MVWAPLCVVLCALPLDSAVLLVRVLDVSDAHVGGDAILITDSAAGRARHLLIDASDRGATVVARLAALHVDTLAAVILSHPHADHYGGLAAVLRRFPVRRFVYGGTPRTAVSYRALLHEIDSLRIPVVTADTGVRRLTLVTGDDTVEMRVLAPPPGCRALPGQARGDDVNNCSVGVRLRRGDFTMLLPGDAERTELGWWMLTEPALLTADVLKAGHHGSANSTSADLLDVVRPAAVIISANGRQHPFADVLAVLAPGTPDLLHRRQRDRDRARARGRRVAHHDRTPGEVSRGNREAMRERTMPEAHRFIVDRREGDLTVVEVDGRGFVDLPRWLLPQAARPDDVLAVTVEPGIERTVITVVRDADATARARGHASEAVARLKRRDPGGDVIL